MSNNLQIQHEGGTAPLASQKATPTTAQNKPEFERLPYPYILVEFDKKNEKKGIYKVQTSNKPDDKQEKQYIRVGDPLYILGYVQDDTSNNWGFLCSWNDPNSKEHKGIVSFAEINSYNAEWFSRIASGGYKGTKKDLTNIFNSIDPKKRYTLIKKTGWYKDCYFLPNKIISNNEVNQSDFYFDSDNTEKLYTDAGELEKWQEVKTLIQGNTRLEFAYLVAFAGVLLDIAGMESGGFAFEGASSSGKTTALRIASAVWGSREHLRQWRTTDNALEGLAVLHNDNILLLDELGQATAEAVSNAVYMLANGQGKTRADRRGEKRQAKKWNVLFLSSGEIGINQKLAENGKKAKAGQEVRYIGIPTAKDHICELHGLESAKDLVDKVKELTSKNYGFDGVKFLEFVIKNYKRICQEINGAISDYAKSFYCGNNSQIERVSNRFALIEYTRYLLCLAGLIDDTFAKGTVKACFADWKADREQAESHEEQEILNAVRLFIETYPSRFQSPLYEFGGIERAGFKDVSEGQEIYYFFPEYFKNHIVKGFSVNFACKVLASNGWLKNESGRNTTRKRFKNEAYQHYYAISLPEAT